MSESGLTAGDDQARRIWFVDLVLGAWRPREAATQLALALGVELVSLHADNPDRAVFATGRRMIDVEAAGDPTVMTAWQDAERIAPLLWAGAAVAVLAPRYGLPLRIDNEWLLFFLRRLGVSVAIVGEEPVFSVGKVLFEQRKVPPPELVARPWLPADHLRLLRFFPGLLPRAVADREKLSLGDAELIPFGADRYLIPLTYRDADPRTAPRDLDAMVDVERTDDGLRGLCQSFCTGYFADPAALVELGRRQFGAGGVDLARGLAERARLVARRPEDIAGADLFRQEIRLFERRFSEVDAAPEPSRQAPPDLRSRLLRAKTIGAAMTGGIAAAERDLEPLVARLKAEEPVGADDLLLLSDLAEARVGKGDIGGGYFLAAAIEAALARDPDADQRLVFRNGLCLVRIHRLRADTGDYRAAVERAYATTLGARTLHEIIEMNVLLAVGEPEKQSQAARLAWLRAALAWLAIEPTEGLSRRAVELVLGGTDAPRVQLDMDVSEALAEALAAAWPNLSLAGRQRFPVIRGIAGAARPPTRMLAGPGAGILWSPEADITAVYARPRQQLIRLVLVALAEVCPGVRETVTGTVLIDANLGVDIPSTREAAISIALRTGAKEFVFGMETLFLDASLRPRLAGELRVALSPIVAGITASKPRSVRFRRYLPDRPLTDDEAKVVALLEGKPPVTLAVIAEQLGRPQDEAEAMLRRLETNHILRLDA